MKISRKWKIHNDYVETVDLISKKKKKKKKKSEKEEVSNQIIIVVILRRIHLSIWDTTYWILINTWMPDSCLANGTV